jgi:hypothetical protein
MSLQRAPWMLKCDGPPPHEVDCPDAVIVELTPAVLETVCEVSATRRWRRGQWMRYVEKVPLPDDPAGGIMDVPRDVCPRCSARWIDPDGHEAARGAQ